VSYADSTVALNGSYVYRVAADNVAGTSAWSNPVTVRVAAPAAPVILTGTAVRAGGNERVTITWGAVPFATSYVVQWGATSTFTTVAGQSAALPANATTYTTGNIARQAWFFRVRAVNVLGTVDSAASPVAAAP
jgi:predicted phage tail protein